MDAQLNAEWQRLKQVLREYRGNVLATSFQIEMALDKLLCEIMFPACDDPSIKPEDIIPITKASAKSLRNLFDEFVLKASTMPTISFGFKIKLLADFAEQISTLQTAMPPNCVFRSMWASDSIVSGPRFRCDVGRDSVAMWAAFFVSP
jgi:hypothetical protein